MVATNSREDLLAEVAAMGGRYVSDKKIFCWHGDTNASGSIGTNNGDNHWRYTCFGCGLRGKDAVDVHDLIKMRTGQGYKGKQTVQPMVQKERFTGKQIKKMLSDIGKVEKRSKYVDPSGRLVGYTIRIVPPDGKKTFRPVITAGDGLWYFEAPVLWPLYRLSEIKKGTVIIVEGEKCADIMADLGYNAITWAGGSNAVDKTDWTPLTGGDAIIWPDTGGPGLKAAEAVKNKITAIGGTARIVDVSALGFTKDNSDVEQYLEMKGPSGVCDLMDQYRKRSVFDEAVEVSGRKLNGELRSVKTIWSVLNDRSKAFGVGNVVVLAGRDGSGKSFFLTEAIVNWIKDGIKVACMMYESGRLMHIERAIAQASCQPLFIDDDWRADPNNTDEIHRILTDNRRLYLQLGDVVTETPDNLPTGQHAIDWLKAKARSGHRVLIVDPVTKMDMGGSGAEIGNSTKGFVHSCLNIARDHECTIILVNHMSEVENDKMVGGASYSQHSTDVLIFKRLEAEEVKIRVEGYRHVAKEESELINRTILIRKSRYGRGSWELIGFLFRDDTLKFEEKGIIFKGKNNE